MGNNINIAKQIKEKRLALNMTMDYVAAKAGITRATLSAIENGETKCSLTNFISVLDVLGLNLTIVGDDHVNIRRDRATRTNTILNKKINRFIVMCIEEYAASINKSSENVYKNMACKGIIDELKNDYEDLHGMSTEYLNSYIKNLI